VELFATRLWTVVMGIVIFYLVSGLHMTRDILSHCPDLLLLLLRHHDYGGKIAAIELQLTGDVGPKLSLAIKAKSSKTALNHGQAPRNRWSHIAGPRVRTSVRAQARGRGG
jgi:hypothetical protein